MEDVIRTRLKLIHDSVLTHISPAQCALAKLENDDADFKELELVGSKLKGANQRLVAEIHNYCKCTTAPDVDEVSQYTFTQIQAEDILAEIEVCVRRNRGTVSTNRENRNMSSKLPRIELAKFNGDVLKWYQFWDQFASNVDSRNISDVEGDAKEAIEGLDTSNKNYRIAVNTLKERYGKPAAIIDAHYVALYRVNAAPTSEVKDCRHVLNEIERHLRVLSSLGEDVNHNHLRVMIMEKFPEELIYELKMKLSGEDESIDSIRKYLEYIISAKETSNRLKRDVSNLKNTETSSIDCKQVGDNFTLGSLHVKAEQFSNNNYQRRYSNFRRDYKSNFENIRSGNKFQIPSRKRPHELSDRTDEPPKRRMRQCVFCRQDHFNDECTMYKTLQDRKSQLKNRCYNCFVEGHRANNCRSKQKCRHCNKTGEHNRALCPKKLGQSAKSIQTDSLHVKTAINTTLLQTCIVNVSDSRESGTRSLQCRVLLDCGSQRSYITESVVSSLRLPVTDKVNLSLFTFGAKTPHHIESPVVSFKLTTRTGVSKLIHANVVPHITNGIQAPIFPDPAKIWNNVKLNGLTFADDGACGDKIDILIGNDYYHSLMSDEKIAVTDDLFLVNSIFGWVWSGKIDEMVEHTDKLTVLTYFQSNAVFDGKFNEPDLPLKVDDVKKLWDLESIGITDSPKSSRDEEAVRQFNETVEYQDSRYHVQWPWTELTPDLPSNLGLAWGRLKSLIKRLDNREIEAYDTVIQSQLQSGIIEVVPDPTVPESHPVHYLPHHCVHSRDKPDKLRIVYDASSKSGDNRSLNECLYRGPTMLEDLTGLLVKFREHPIGIVADVEKAFLQLGLQASDKDVTRFLWIKDISRGPDPDNVLHLRFCRVPFGIISSPFLLNATIKYHLTKLNNALMQQIADDIYVDNIVTGAQTVSDALRLFTLSKQSFDSLSMNLREWNSNSKDLMSQIPNDIQDHNKNVKVLGLLWDIGSDTLRLKINFENENLMVQTKRDVLKIIASIYDPCGFAIPVVLPAKLFFQKLWKEKVKWDTKLNDSQLGEWNQIASNFSCLKDLHVDRYYANNICEIGSNNDIQYELHCFTDSSMDAYAAVIYLRSSLDANNIVSFVIGKSRLVPLKDQHNLQIPRLELLGVLIGCRLLNYVVKFLRLQVRSQYLWIDSQIVLGWCKSEKLLPPFVARRISEIRQNKRLLIRYVPTKLNPADVGTRSERVDSYDRWLKGPDFLMRDSKEWPISNKSIDHVQISLAGEGLAKSRDIPEDNVDRQTDRAEPMTIDSDPRQTDNDDTNRILEIQKEHFPKETEGETTDLSRSL